MRRAGPESNVCWANPSVDSSPKPPEIQQHPVQNALPIERGMPPVLRCGNAALCRMPAASFCLCVGRWLYVLQKGHGNVLFSCLLPVLVRSHIFLMIPQIYNIVNSTFRNGFGCFFKNRELGEQWRIRAGGSRRGCAQTLLQQGVQQNIPHTLDSRCAFGV